MLCVSLCVSLVKTRWAKRNPAFIVARCVRSLTRTSRTSLQNRLPRVYPKGTALYILFRRMDLQVRSAYITMPARQHHFSPSLGSDARVVRANIASSRCDAVTGISRNRSDFDVYDGLATHISIECHHRTVSEKHKQTPFYMHTQHNIRQKNSNLHSPLLADTSSTSAPEHTHRQTLHIHALTGQIIINFSPNRRAFDSSACEGPPHNTRSEWPACLQPVNQRRRWQR